jgi:hypothetical protein
MSKNRSAFFKLDCDWLKESTQLMQWGAQPDKEVVLLVLTWGGQNRETSDFQDNFSRKVR